jgi:hypothetical protein
MTRTDVAMRSFGMHATALKLVTALQDTKVDEMPVHKMKFVLVNDMAPRRIPICVECSRPLELGYLHDLATSTRYCGVECYLHRMVVGGFDESIALTNPFELAIVWPKLTIDVASALFENAWRDHGD